MTDINLKDPFPFADIEYRIGASTDRNGRASAMLVFYIDARAVQDRLDAYAASVGGTWYDSYAPLADGIHVECQLTVEMPAAGGNLRPITRCDVGEPSEGMGDKVKGAYSSALKRAAVKFGIGRYLYALGEKWVPCEFIEGQGKPRPRLTQESHDAARRFYIDRIGVAAEPAGTGPQRSQEHADAPEDARPVQPATNGNGRVPGHASAADLQAFWPAARALGYTPGQVADYAGRPVPDLTKAELDELLSRLKASVAGCVVKAPAA